MTVAVTRSRLRSIRALKSILLVNMYTSLQLNYQDYRDLCRDLINYLQVNMRLKLSLKTYNNTEIGDMPILFMVTDFIFS